MKKIYIFLKSQIEFFKEELREKNKMITSLLQDTNSFKVMETGSLSCNEQEHINIRLTVYKISQENVNGVPIINKINKTKDISKIPSIVIFGDNHLNPINPKGLTNKKNVSVRNHPGSNTEDLKSYTIPTIKNGKDVIVIHSGCTCLVELTQYKTCSQLPTK